MGLLSLKGLEREEVAQVGTRKPDATYASKGAPQARRKIRKCFPFH